MSARIRRWNSGNQTTPIQSGEYNARMYTDRLHDSAQRILTSRFRIGEISHTRTQHSTMSLPTVCERIELLGMNGFIILAIPVTVCLSVSLAIRCSLTYSLKLFRCLVLHCDGVLVSLLPSVSTISRTQGMGCVTTPVGSTYYEWRSV